MVAYFVGPHRLVYPKSRDNLTGYRFASFFFDYTLSRELDIFSIQSQLQEFASLPNCGYRPQFDQFNVVSERLTTLPNQSLTQYRLKNVKTNLSSSLSITSGHIYAQSFCASKYFQRASKEGNQHCLSGTILAHTLITLMGVERILLENPARGHQLVWQMTRFAFLKSYSDPYNYSKQNIPPLYFCDILHLLRQNLSTNTLLDLKQLTKRPNNMATTSMVINNHNHSVTTPSTITRPITSLIDGLSDILTSHSLQINFAVDVPFVGIFKLKHHLRLLESNISSTLPVDLFLEGVLPSDKQWIQDILVKVQHTVSQMLPPEILLPGMMFHCDGENMLDGLNLNKTYWQGSVILLDGPNILPRLAINRTTCLISMYIRSQCDLITQMSQLIYFGLARYNIHQIDPMAYSGWQSLIKLLVPNGDQFCTSSKTEPIPIDLQNQETITGRQWLTWCTNKNVNNPLWMQDKVEDEADNTILQDYHLRLIEEACGGGSFINQTTVITNPRQHFFALAFMYGALLHSPADETVSPLSYILVRNQVRRLEYFNLKTFVLSNFNITQFKSFLQDSLRHQMLSTSLKCRACTLTNRYPQDIQWVLPIGSWFLWPEVVGPISVYWDKVQDIINQQYNEAAQLAHDKLNPWPPNPTTVATTQSTPPISKTTVATLSSIVKTTTQLPETRHLADLLADLKTPNTASLNLLNISTLSTHRGVSSKAVDISFPWTFIISLYPLIIHLFST
jgi:hypothetical protein